VTRAAAVVGFAAVVTACASGGGTAASTSSATSGTPPGTVTDSVQGTGSLRQDEISLQVALSNVGVQLLPTAESVIRVLAPDSYRTVSNIVVNRAAEIDARARPLQLRDRQVWMVTFVGLTPGARFTPGDLTIAQSGREYRPVAMIPITRGFGDGRLQPGEPQRALYLFEDGLSLSQPLTVTVAGVRSSEWEAILRTIDREKALMRARKG
jgi:hypothetical protein